MSTGRQQSLFTSDVNSSWQLMYRLINIQFQYPSNTQKSYQAPKGNMKYKHLYLLVECQIRMVINIDEQGRGITCSSSIPLSLVAASYQGTVQERPLTIQKCFHLHTDLLQLCKLPTPNSHVCSDEETSIRKGMEYSNTQFR